MSLQAVEFPPLFFFLYRNQPRQYLLLSLSLSPAFINILSVPSFRRDLFSLFCFVLLLLLLLQLERKRKRERERDRVFCLRSFSIQFRAPTRTALSLRPPRWFTKRLARIKHRGHIEDRRPGISSFPRLKARDKASFLREQLPGNRRIRGESTSESLPVTLFVVSSSFHAV